MSEPQITRRKITDFTPDPENANAGTERGLRVLDDSIAETGLGRSAVVDKNGVIIAGNKTAERALDRGIEDAIVVHTTGKQLVIVQRDDLDLGDDDPNNPARKMAYYDNRSGQLGLSWDAERITADVAKGVDLSAMFTPVELEELAAPDITPPEDFAEYGEDIETEYCCPKCGYKWSGKPNADE